MMYKDLIDATGKRKRMQNYSYRYRKIIQRHLKHLFYMKTWSMHIIIKGSQEINNCFLVVYIRLIFLPSFPSNPLSHILFSLLHSAKNYCARVHRVRNVNSLLQWKNVEFCC